jgi:hypothetical protein
MLPPFNLEGGSVNPNDHSHNSIQLQMLVDVIACPSIKSPYVGG